jgi:4a-hydroxytetrahydrobiopterin dehydratase
LTLKLLTGSVMGMTLLSPTEIDSALDSLPGWGGNADDIRCRYAAADFPAAIALVDAVAGAAEAAGHHPDIDIRYNEVLFVLSTHSERGVTSNDIDLAKTIDGLARAAGLTPAAG